MPSETVKKLKITINNDFGGDYERASRFILIPDYVLKRFVDENTEPWHSRDREKILDYLEKYDKKKEVK